MTDHARIRQASFGLATRQVEAEQKLAAAVIALAVDDVQNRWAPRSARWRAAAFLSGSDALRFWCDVARLPP